MDEPKIFEPSGGSVVARYVAFAILSWYQEDIGAHIHIYCRGAVWTRIDYGNKLARKEFILGLLRNEQERLAIRQRFQFSEDDMKVIDLLIEQLESLG